MCMAIYAALFALLLYYSDFLIEPFALSVQTGEGEWMVVALGWEMVPLLWPVMLLLMVAASGVTLLVARRLGTRPGGSNERESVIAPTHSFKEREGE
jgi:membrane protein implicated in regulation of membrane protease activity